MRRQAAFVGRFDELVDQLGGGGVTDPASLLAGRDAQAYEQVTFPGAGRDSDRLQQLRAVLPCEVRVTAVTHPLFGRLLAASGFKRRGGVLSLVVMLPDGSPGHDPRRCHRHFGWSADRRWGDGVVGGGVSAVA